MPNDTPAYPKSRWEEFATSKFPRDGKCKKSCFANGNHRVGIIPLYSLLDGGASGDSAREICLECEKIFDQPRWFIIKKQPRFIGDKSAMLAEYEKRGKG